MGDGPHLYQTEADAQEGIRMLRNLGDEWAAAEYRYREATARELVRMLAARGGVSAVLAEVLDANLDEAERREAERAR